jgi:hypothetical protein
VADVYLWFCCEGWKRLGPFKWLRFDEKGMIRDQDGNIVARCDEAGKAWEILSNGTRCVWHDPMITASPRHPHPNSGA